MKKIALQTLSAIVIFIALSAVFFWPYLEGQRIYQSDIVQYLGMTQEINKVEKEIGRKPLWTNAMFGGMPTYQINTPHKGNYLFQINQLLRLGRENQNPIGFLFTGMLSMYLLLMVLRLDYRLAIIGGIAFGLATNNIILYEAGHLSKLSAISYLPLMTAGLILAYRRQYWWGFFLFSAGFGLNLSANHVQMTYYFFLIIPFFLLPVLIRAVKAQTLPAYLKASVFLLLGFVLALGSAVSNLWSTYEYSKETIRGNSVLTTAEDEFVDSTFLVSKSSGLDWNYAMEFSNGAIDLLACVIPGAAGSSSQARLFDHSELSKELQQQGAIEPAKLRAPLYWGALPFTSGPVYFGVVMVFFFILGLFIIKGPLKWWLGLSSLFIILLSMGKNLPVLNEWIYHYIPLYNKFRTPNSILSIISLMITLLGILALHKIFLNESKQDYWPLIKKTGVRLITFMLSLVLLGPYLFSFGSPLDVQYELGGIDLEKLVADRKYMFRRDSLRSALLISVAMIILWVYIRKRIKIIPAILCLGILILFDFWAIDCRFINRDSFEPERKYQRVFDPRPVDDQISRDPDPNFRVLDWTVNTFNSSTTSYFHKSIGGYHAAKLRRYQDVIEQYLVRGDRGVLNMLNTKYIIQTGDDGNPVVLNNLEVLGNAWLIDSFYFVETANEELEALDHINPADVAVIHSEYRPYLQELIADTTGEINLVRYIPDHLTYSVKSTGEMFAVFSEIWYGPEKGWDAYVDGKPVEHIRVNYLLRGLRIPPGEHTVEFIFQPRSFYTGRTISRITSALILYGFIWFIGMQLFARSFSTKAKKPKKKGEPDLLLDDMTIFRHDLKVKSGKTVSSPDPGTISEAESIIPARPADFRIFSDHRLLPRVFYILSGIILIVMLGMSLGSGINADEEYQTDYAERLVNFYTSFGKDTSALYIEKGNMHLYGGFFDLTTGLVNHLLGFNEYDSGYHRVRHLFIALLGFITIWFASLLTSRIAGWRAAILVLLFLFLSPRFLGHSMMNPKDIPFATGYIMAIYFMVRFFSKLPKPHWIDLGGIILGIGIALGTRAGGLLVIAFLLVFGAIDFLLKYPFRKWTFQNIGHYLKYLLLLSAGGYFLAVLFWPAALVDPLYHPLEALRSFEDLNVYIRLLFKGENVMSDQVSGDYVLVWMWKTIPVFCLTGIIGSIALFNTTMKKYPILPVLILLITAIFPVLYILIQKSVLHDGWRHLLFIYPSAAILAVLFWIGLENHLKERKIILYSIYGLLGLTLIESGIFIFRNHSYPYVYFNPVAGGLKKAYGNFETDYWGISVKGAVDWMEDQQILDAQMTDTITVATSFYYNVTHQLAAGYRNKVKIIYLRYSERYREKWDYAIYPSRFVDGIQLRSGNWPPSETIHTINANGVPLVAILGSTQESIQQGIEANVREDWLQAIQLLEEGLLQFPNNVEALRALAVAKMKTGTYDEALELTGRSLEIGGPDAATYAIEGQIYLQKQNNEKAKQAYFQAVGISSDFYQGYFGLAVIYKSEKNLIAALEYALKSIEIKADFTEAYQLVAELYEEQANLERAEFYRKEYLRLSQS